MVKREQESRAAQCPLLACKATAIKDAAGAAFSMIATMEGLFI